MRFKTLLMPLLAAPLIVGCLTSTDLPPLTVLSAGWLAGDSVLMYTVHDRPENGRKARLRVFVARVDSTRQVTENTQVFAKDSAWGCSDLRLSDTLVSMSYFPYPLPEFNRPQEGCSPQQGSALVALSRQGSTLSPRAAAVDTAALRIAPPGSPPPSPGGFEQRGSLNTYFKLCLTGGPCLEDVVLEHDAKR